ncbi:type II and III secretion system protein RhcC2, partial [Pseudomonas syringae pv. actinidiae]
RDTRVEVGSGQTFAIAGLFQRESSQDMDKVPMLGDMPILGNLFRSKRFQRNETELVILITPYLVEPVKARVVATPLDKQRAASTASAGPRSGGAFGFYMN